MPYLPVDTAVVLEVGPLIDPTDFKTLEEAIAYNESGMTVDLIVNSGTAITKTDITLTTGGNNDWTHKGNGVYEVEITAAQNTQEGTMRLVGNCDNSLPFESPVYTVVPSMVYNSLVLGTDVLEVDVEQAGGSSIQQTGGEFHVLDGSGNAVATASAQTTAQNDLDTLTGSDGATLATSQPNYAPSTHSAADVWSAATRNLNSDANNAIRDAVLSDATKIPGASIDATISSRSSHTANNVRDAILSDSTPFAGASIDAAVSSRSSHSAADVWAVGTREITGGTVGSVTNDVGITQAGADKVWGSATRNLNSDANNTIRDSILSDATTFAGGNINATISSRSSHAAADVWSVGTREITGGTISTVSDKTGYSISGSKTTLDALNDLSASDVNDEVLDVLNTDTFGLIGQEAPGATVTLAYMIRYMYKKSRNQITDDGTDLKLFNDGATVVDQKASVSESGGTVTKGQWGSGP